MVAALVEKMYGAEAFSLVHVLMASAFVGVASYLIVAALTGSNAHAPESRSSRLWPKLWGLPGLVALAFVSLSVGSHVVFLSTTSLRWSVGVPLVPVAPKHVVRPLICACGRCDGNGRAQ